MKKLSIFYNDTTNKYMYQYGDFITNSYCIIKTQTILKKSNKLKESLQNFWNDYENNYKIDYEIKDIDIKKMKLTDGRIFYDLKDKEYSIDLQLLRRIYLTKKFDRILVMSEKEYIKYNAPVVKLLKDNEIIGYCLPCRNY